MDRRDVGITISHLLEERNDVVRLRAYATRRGWIIRYRTNEPEETVEETDIVNDSDVDGEDMLPAAES